MKILIVDDRPANLLTLEDILGDLSANIVRANSGEEALKILLQMSEPPVLAILDVQMPGMNGYELAESMRSHPRMRFIPVIFLSAIYNEERYINHGYSNGCVDFLTKPFNPDILRAKVSVFLNLERYRRDAELAHFQREQLLFEKAAEREYLQKQLYQAQKMESLGQLTSGIAHDFNNILAGILGYADLAKMYLDDITPPAADHLEDCLHQIEIASNRATNLIKQMLSYTRQDAIVNDESPESIKPQTVIEEVLSMLRVTLTPNIKIETDLSEEVPNIFIHPTKLHQVLTNLIVNARDAIGDETGSITVSLHYVKVNSLCSDCHLMVEGEYVDVSVSDTGSGIPPDKITNIFDPFFTTKAVGKGTGLGLSVVSGLIHKVRGHIVLSSKVGEGTTFRILFPTERTTEE